MKTKIIYDIGSNNGDDIPYYLLKSDLVVAIEANPFLCHSIGERFSSEIKQGKLIVENCVITSDQNGIDVDFYIHKRYHVLSQFPKPSSNRIESFEKKVIPAKSVEQLISEHGDPYYIKIDVEHYDSEILLALWQAKIYPPYISAESHTIKVFSLLVSMGYSAFKLVEGSDVSEQYSNCVIESENGDGDIAISFPQHSAGPFGNDINGGWMSEDNFYRLLAYKGLGWKDIHASLIDIPDPQEFIRIRELFKQAIYQKLLLLKNRFLILVTWVSA